MPSVEARGLVKVQNNLEAAEWKATVLAEELCRLFEKIQSAPHSPPPECNTVNSAFQDQEIEEHEVDYSMNKVFDRSSPGYDLIKPRALKILWKLPAWRGRILTCSRGMWTHPLLFSPFKHGIVHPVKKPNGAYRPITLL